MVFYARVKGKGKCARFRIFEIITSKKILFIKSSI
jgi:hypothetical protein